MHMRRMMAALLVLLVGLQPTALLAQQAAQSPAPASAPLTPPQVPATQAAPSSKDVPDINALGVSFDRIKQLLGEKKPTDDKNGLKLNYYVEVVALAPRLQLFTREELAPGGGVVPWGAPTHADIVNMLTPIEFRSPRVDVSSLAILGIMKLAQWEAERMKRYKAEEARRKQNEEERRRQKALEESGLVIVKPSK
jgi:hypothetical protein